MIAVGAIAASRRRSGNGSFDPATLFASGETGGWWDPSDFSTMWQDVSATIPVTAAGQNVARIDDKSGNGNNLTRPETASQPTLRQDAGGNWYLEADDSNDNLVKSFSPAIAQPFTRMGAIQQDGWTSGRRMYSDGHFLPTFLYQNTSTPRLQMNAGSNGPFTDAATIGTPVVLTEFYSGASSTLTVNDGTAATGNAGTNGQNAFQLFSNGAAAIGRNYGFIIINRALTVDELDELRQFFADKAGVTL